MEKDILRQVTRQTITEMFDLLDKGMLGSEQITGKVQYAIEEQLNGSEVGKEPIRTIKFS